MAPRRSADGCIRRPQSSRWTRRAAPTEKRAKGGIFTAMLTSRCGTRLAGRSVFDSGDCNRGTLGTDAEAGQGAG